MEYSYDQYQADRKLLRFRNAGAGPIAATLPLKRDKAMAWADPADHVSIQAAYERLLVVAEAGPEAIPLPPLRAARLAAPAPVSSVSSPGQGAGDASAGAIPAEPKAAGEAEFKVDYAAQIAWGEALREQAARHARRRAAWKDLAPPFKEPFPPA